MDKHPLEKVPSPCPPPEGEGKLQPDCSKSPYSISVVIPGYNEEANIKATVVKCLEALRKLTDRYEVVIVNDCSTDRMPEIADRLAREFPEITVIHNPINLHVGISVMIGMKAAKNELVVHNAMDCPFDLADLANALPLFPEHDVVIVSRLNRSAHSLWRKITSLTHYWMVRILFRAPFSDMNFVQVYKREVLQTVKVKGKSPAFVTPELLIRSKRLGFKIGEIKAIFHRREKGAASCGKPRDILWTLADMWAFCLEGSPHATRRANAQTPASAECKEPVHNG